MPRYKPRMPKVVSTAPIPKAATTKHKHKHKNKNKAVTTEPYGNAATTEYKPKAVTTEPNGKTAITEYKPKAVTTEPNGKAATTEYKPKAVTTEPNGKTATTEYKPKAVTTEPQPTAESTMPAKWQLIDLEGDPNCLPEHVQIYLSLVAEAMNRGPGPYKNTGECGDVQSADHLVTPSNVAAGQDILRREKRDNPTGRGRIFHGALGHNPSARPLFPYLPTALNFDDIIRISSVAEPLPGAIVDKFGEAMVLTDYAAPFPSAWENLQPKSLLHAVVAWMYTTYHPSGIAGDAPYSDIDGIDEELLDMDECYPDEWIVDQMLTGVRSLVTDYRGVFAGPHPGHESVRSVYPWIESTVPAFLP